VTLGQSDDRFVEVVAGLKPGESVAATNTFVLKAELLKALAED
jgi:membrane fusion protein, heavy metal efflux system